jgi:hypothetical protein
VKQNNIRWTKKKRFMKRTEIRNHPHVAPLLREGFQLKWAIRDDDGRYWHVRLLKGAFVVGLYVGLSGEFAGFTAVYAELRVLFDKPSWCVITENTKDTEIEKIIGDVKRLMAMPDAYQWSKSFGYHNDTRGIADGLLWPESVK